jgi:small subunit ribosomal protein S1
LLHVSEMAWSRVSDTAQVVTPGEEITVKVLRVDDETQKIALGLKQLGTDPWSTVQATYEVGQVRTGRVTRLTEFGAFVELEPGVEGLAHASTFAPTGHSKGWSRSVAVGLTAAFEVLSIDLERKRIGVALVEDGSARAGGMAPLQSELLPGARLTGKVAVLDAREADDVREHAEHADVASPEGFGSIADKLRAALKPREK